MKTLRQVGIVGYGAYVPMYRLNAAEINRMWGTSGAPVEEKSVVALDEDTVTISVECAKQAVKRAGINPSEIGAVYVGTESKPYAVKPCGTIVAEAIGATPSVSTADYEFACKAGTEAMQTCIGLVGSGMQKYAMAIGADTAQGRPADALEYTAACGGAAFIFAERSAETVAYVEASYSYVTDTPDFWRRAKEMYPRHGNRFTGEPAYFKHIMGAAKGLLQETGYKPDDFKYAVFHQPNTKFPITVARNLGFSMDQINPGLVVDKVGNTYRAKNNWFFVFDGHLEIVSWQPSGKADLTILGPGQGTTIKAGAWHRFKALTDTRAIELYWTELDPEDIERRTQGGGSDEENAPGCPRNADQPRSGPREASLYVKKEAAPGSGKPEDRPGGHG